MKKWQFYYILIISALISVMSAGMLKEVLTSNERSNILPLIYVSLLFIFSGILIFNIKKLKLNIENSFFIDSKIYINTSIIGLFLLTLNFIIGQITTSIKLSERGFTTSPILYILIIVFSIYMFFLVKLFIELRKESDVKNNSTESIIYNTLNVNEINLKEFRFLGELSKKLDHNQFIEKKEFNIDRKTYNNYRPILHSKKYNEEGDLILNFTNKEDLIFIVLIQNFHSVSIKFNSKNKSNEMIGKEVYKTLNT